MYLFIQQLNTTKSMTIRIIMPWSMVCIQCATKWVQFSQLYFNAFERWNTLQQMRLKNFIDNLIGTYICILHMKLNCDITYKESAQLSFKACL